MLKIVPIHLHTDITQRAGVKFQKRRNIATKVPGKINARLERYACFTVMLLFLK